MYEIDWQIVIGKYELMALDRVKILHSVEKLSDTADIVLPASCFNEALEVEKKITRGDKVLILAGYDGTLVNEFSGWLEAISTDDGSLTLKCEDDIFLFRKPVPDKEFIGPDVKDILKYICGKVGVHKLSCDYCFKYDKYVIKGATGYDVLKKLQEECRADIYMVDGTLHVHPQYKQIFGTVKYSFQHNIEKSELEYKDARDRVVEVVVEGKGKDGKVVRQTAGTTGGDQVTIRIDGVSDIATLKAVAEEQLKIKSYTGYSGSFTGWMLPYCNAGYKATINDEDYEYKDGDYYVTEVETTISSAGGSREISLGMKL
jgi:hypothetical protein